MRITDLPFGKNYMEIINSFTKKISTRENETKTVEVSEDTKVYYCKNNFIDIELPKEQYYIEIDLITKELIINWVDAYVYYEDLGINTKSISILRRALEHVNRYSKQ